MDLAKGTCREAFLERSRISRCAKVPFSLVVTRLPNWGRYWKLQVHRKMYEVAFGKMNPSRFLNNIKSATSDLISIKIHNNITKVVTNFVTKVELRSALRSS